MNNDGGKNNFYKFPDWVEDVDSLARYLRLTPPEFNIMKSLTSNIGKRHTGTNKTRELKKSLHYVIERMLWEDISSDEIFEQVKKHLDR